MKVLILVATDKISCVVKLTTDKIFLEANVDKSLLADFEFNIEQVHVVIKWTIVRMFHYFGNEFF